MWRPLSSVECNPLPILMSPVRSCSFVHSQSKMQRTKVLHRQLAEHNKLTKWPQTTHASTRLVIVHLGIIECSASSGFSLLDQLLWHVFKHPAVALCQPRHLNLLLLS